MKTWMPIFVSILLIFYTLVPLNAGDLKTLTLKVDGMTCALCAPAVKVALERVSGVKKAEVIYEEKKAIVEYDGDMANLEDLISAVEKTGFKAYLEEEKQ